MLLDRVVETTDVVGTGTMNLLGAATIDGVVMRRFVTIAGSGKTVAYLIVDTAGNWEFGIGVVTSGSPDTLTRATILRSSNSDAAVSFLSGTKYVYATANSDLLRFGSHGLPTLGGTADARTLANAPPLKALTPGMTFVVLNGAAANATTTPNVTIDSIAGAKTVVAPAGGALGIGDMAASGLLVLTWDGTNLRLRNPATQTQSVAISTQSGDYTALAADRGKLIDFTGAATLSLTAAATLGAGWFCDVRNSNSAARVVIDPNSTEQVDGAATQALVPGETCRVVCDGAAFKTEGRSLAGLPRSYLAGLTLSNNGTDATNDIDVAVGAARDDGNAADLVLASALTKRLDAAWAVGTNQGGLDTGSIANGTYHIWLIKRPDTGVVDVLFSASASSPTMPANYTLKRRIGSILRESAAIVGFDQKGDEFLRKATVLDVAANNPGTSAVTRTLSVPTGLRVWALMHAQLTNVGTGVTAFGLISELDRNDEAVGSTTAPLSTNANVANAAGNAASATQRLTIRTNTSAQVRSRLNASDASVTFYIATVGWIDRRGRDD